MAAGPTVMEKKVPTWVARLLTRGDQDNPYYFRSAIGPFRSVMAQYAYERKARTAVIVRNVAAPIQWV